MKPTLLRDWQFHNITGWMMSEKLDGWRMLWDGVNFLSRQGLVLDAPDWFKAGMPSTALDGELFAGRGRFNFIQGMMRDGWHGLTFHVFDSPTAAGGFAERHKSIQSLALPLHVHIVKHSTCFGHDYMMDAAMDICKMGGEGVVLRDPSAKYIHGRTDKVLRYVPVAPEVHRVKVA